MSRIANLTNQLEDDVEKASIFVHGDEDATYPTKDGAKVPSIRNLQKKADINIDDAKKAAISAEASAEKAESAASAANFSSGVFESVEIGIENTQPNDFFNVVSDDDYFFVDLYENKSGKAILRKTYPSSYAFEKLHNSAALRRGRIPENTDILKICLENGTYIIPAGMNIKGLPVDDPDFDINENYYLRVSNPGDDDGNTFYQYSLLELIGFNPIEYQSGVFVRKVFTKRYSKLNNTDNTWVNETVRNTGDLMQFDLFSIKGKHISPNHGIELDSSGISAVTDFIDILGISSIDIFGRSSDFIALVAFYDINRKFISAIAGASNNKILRKVKPDDIPANARYIRCTGNNDKSDYIFISNQDYILSSNERVSKSLSDLSGAIIKDKSWGKDGIKYREGAACTVAIPISIGDKFLYGGTVNSGDILIHPLFDENMNIIGSFDRLSPSLTITEELYSELGGRYVAFTFRKGDVFALSIDSYLNSVSGKLLKLENFAYNNQSNVKGIMLAGASLSYDRNSWFNDSINKLGCIGYNKAISGVATPIYDANRWWRGSYCTDDEFENSDIFAIQYASQTNLSDKNGLKDLAVDYTQEFDLAQSGNPFEIYTHAQALDFILKNYQERCYAQRLNEESKWFGTKHGKPCVIVFVTHWHDSRPYNSDAVRELSNRWGAYLCEFDRKIGFSRNQTLLNGDQVSTIYAADNQTIDGIVYGWHPLRGKEGIYIQSKMTSIFVNAIKQISL